MTPQERDLLTGLFERVRGAAANPRDRDAEALIAEAVRQQPYAPYLLTQTVIVQEEALKAAGQRIEELDARTRDLETQLQLAQVQLAQVQQAQAQPNAGNGSFLGGIGKSIFGSSEPAPQPRSSVPTAGSQPSAVWTQQGQPQGYGQSPAPPSWGGQPQPQQAPQAEAGGGFLKGALGAAAGVAGGMLLANSISGLFKGGSNPLGIGGDQSHAKSGEGSSSSPFERRESALDDKSGGKGGGTDGEKYQSASYNKDEESDEDDSDDDSDWGDDDDGTTEA